MFLLLLGLACVETPDLQTEGPPAAEEEALHGRLDSTGPHPILYLWGSRAEMGYAEGALTCERIAPLFKDYLLEHLVGEYTDYTYDIIRGVVIGSVKYTDADMEELTAFYQGALDHCTEEQLTVESDLLEPQTGGRRMLEFEDLLFANAVADFGCSSFSVWGEASATGDTINGRNFDWAVDPKGTFSQNHMIKVYDSTDEGARFASLMVPAMLGCVSCVTEEGVALTMHNEGGLEATYNTDISPRMMSARAALAATYGADDVVASAEEVLESRRERTGNNLHLAFPVGRSPGGIGAVVFEYDGNYEHPDGQVTVRRPGEDADLPRTDAIVATNHYMKRRAPSTEGDSYNRAMSLRLGIEATVAEGIQPDDGRGFLRGVQLASGGLTVHSVLLDTKNRNWSIFVTPDAVTPAPDAEPDVLNLDELFGGLP